MDVKIKVLSDWHERSSIAPCVIKEAGVDSIEQRKWQGIPVWSQAGIGNKGAKINEKALKEIIHTTVTLNTRKIKRNTKLSSGS